MLSPRLTDCAAEITPSVLIYDIDQRLTQLANDQYNNIVYSLNYYIPGEVIGDLLHYKQILTYRLCNPDYACSFTTQQIGSRVKVLIHK